MGGVAEGAWAVYDETISVRKIKGTMDRSKSEYPLAQLLEAIGNAPELGQVDPNSIEHPTQSG